MAKVRYTAADDLGGTGVYGRLLYVGDLEASVGNAKLYELFNKIGPVDYVRVCMDLTSRKSLGYGYVKYLKVQDAAKAKEMLNYTALNGKSIRVLFSNRDPIMCISPGKIFIKNLDKSVDHKGLHHTFSRYGNILSCKIAKDFSGQSKGHGFVEYDSEHGARKAIEQMDGMRINNRQVFVEPFLSKQEIEMAADMLKFTMVSVGNLSEATTEEVLHNKFGKFGKITSVVVMRGGDGKSKCFGFVNFKDAYSAAKSVRALNGKRINGKKWRVVGEAQKRPEREHDIFYGQGPPAFSPQKFIMPGCSFKDVLLGPIIKPITLNVTPGDEVILENIILDEDERVDPSLVKGFHEEFKDKSVCIFLLPMCPGRKNSMVLDTTRLRDVYEQVKSSGGKFNVICVPTHVVHNKNDFEYFNPYQEQLKIICRTSFHHIHIDDSACLKRMESVIGFPKDPEAAYVILGPMNGLCRRVVTILDSDFIKWHGAEAFPFTTGKIQQLARKDEALWSGKHDLGTLLSLPDRDFVISNDCTKVPISDLHQRTVCLLFYEDTLECRNWTEKLKKLYVARKDFEVVVVFSITFGHDQSVEFKNRRRLLKFWKVFGEMPWLAIPLDDPKCRQLWRILSKLCSDTPKLLIIYSGGKYFEENGFKVLEETGFKNYPFMREEVVRTSVAVREKNLSSFLGRNELIRGRDLDYVGREKFTASKLLGVSVVLLFLGVPGFRGGFSDLLAGLHIYHIGCARCTDRFEIVYIPMTESPPEIVPECDWMLISPCKEHLIPCFHNFFEDEINQNPGKQFTMAMVSFGQFGQYNDRGIIYTNYSESAYKLFLDTFPFDGNEEKECFKVLYSGAINRARKKTDNSDVLGAYISLSSEEE